MTIAQQLKITDFPFIIKDASGELIYHEYSSGLIIDNRPKTDVQKAIELLTKAGLIIDSKILNKL